MGPSSRRDMPLEGCEVEPSELLQWWNLIFELPLLGAALYIVLLSTSTLDQGHDLEADAQEPLPPDHAIASSSDLHLDSQELPAQGGLGQALDFLGIGKVPLSIVLPTFFLLWSFAGFTSNIILGRFVALPQVYVGLSVVLATLVGVIVTRHLSLFLASVLPRTQSYGIDIEDLAGLVGVAGSPGVTSTFGEAQVYDKYDNQHTVSCRVRPGESQIHTGSRILLIDYDRKRRVFIVEPYSD